MLYSIKSLLIVLLVVSSLLLAPINNMNHEETEDSFSTSMSRLKIYALFFNTTDNSLVENVSVSFYMDGKLAIRVVTENQPVYVSIQSGTYLVYGEYANSSLSEEINVKEGDGEIIIYIEEETNTIVEISYFYLKGVEEKARIKIYAKYFNATDQSYIENVKLSFYRNNSLVMQVTTKNEPIFLEVALDTHYIIEIRYLNNTKYVNVVFGSIIRDVERLFVIYISREDNSILFANVFLSEPHVYGDENNVSIIARGNDSFSTIIGVKVFFYKFYENGSVLLEKHTITGENTVSAEIRNGYYVIMVEYTDNKYLGIYGILWNEPLMLILIDENNGKIIGINFLITVYNPNQDSNNLDPTKIIFSNSVIIIGISLIAIITIFSITLTRKKLSTSN